MFQVGTSETELSHLDSALNTHATETALAQEGRAAKLEDSSTLGCLHVPIPFFPSLFFFFFSQKLSSIPFDENSPFSRWVTVLIAVSSHIYSSAHFLPSFISKHPPSWSLRICKIQSDFDRVNYWTWLKLGKGKTSAHVFFRTLWDTPVLSHYYWEHWK
jgi:hypothetical protein